MGKRKEKKPTTIGLSVALQREYARWKEIFNTGCNDPFWKDGTNINLVRNHIIYYKRQCDTAFGDKHTLYPEEYFYPLPVELSSDFMAKDRVISGELFVSTNNMCYNEAIRFDWSEIFN